MYYVLCFFGGVFVANFVPHYVSGVCGISFPTPFNRLLGQPAPPVGLSPPPLNVTWALANLALGYVLLRYGHFFTAYTWSIAIAAFLGFGLMSLAHAHIFRRVPR